jgi:hypothetical protein
MAKSEKYHVSLVGSGGQPQKSKKGVKVKKGRKGGKRKKISGGGRVPGRRP